MATTVAIGVTTGDAAPSSAPHRISNKAAKNAAALVITPTNSGGAAIRALMIRMGGATPYTGVLLGRRGLVCSDSEPCSEALACTDWDSPSGSPIAEDATYVETGGPADGNQTVNVYVAAGTEGWS